MPNLMKWFMHTNEKSTFALCFCILLASVGVSAWIFTTIAKDNATPMVDPANRTRPLPSHIQTSIGLTDYVNRQLNDEFVIPVNPFAPSLSVANIERILAGRNNNPDEDRRRWPPVTTSGNTANNTNKPNTPGSVTVQTTNQPNTPRTAPPVTLTYKGYMTRVDGVPLAFIQNSTTKETKFYAANQTAPAKDATLLAVTHEAVTLRLPDGTEKKLNLGESLEF